MEETLSRKVNAKIDLSHVENPIGLDGFEFMEIATTNPEEVFKTFETFGFQRKGKNPRMNITLMTQGNIKLIVNAEPGSYAHNFAKQHGHSVVSQGYRVTDAKKAVAEAVKRGAKEFTDRRKGDLNLPAIYGLEDALIQFVDDSGLKALYESDYEANPEFDPKSRGVGLEFIDHLDHNVAEGHLEKYTEFYTRIFNFQEVRNWQLEGEQTGINSQALISPCGKILVPIVQSNKGSSYVKEYLELHQGDGIQHMAFYTDDICQTIEDLRARGQTFLDVPDSYYEEAQSRLDKNKENYDRVKRNHILIDGNGKEYMLQIFTTKDLMNPIFFEFIQRDGYMGFGEKNFPALFDCLERDQIKRGYLKQ